MKPEPIEKWPGQRLMTPGQLVRLNVGALRTRLWPTPDCSSDQHAWMSFNQIALIIAGGSYMYPGSRLLLTSTTIGWARLNALQPLRHVFESDVSG